MRHRLSWISAVALTAVLQLFVAVPAFAQATRTWVSGVGDDANPCSRTAPCKTFAGAISKTAAGGEISVLDPGGYGALTITKAITINGQGTLASILVVGTNAINVAAGQNDVVILRNISLDGVNGGLHGINFLSGGQLHVENVTIFGFSGGQGIFFQPSSASSLFLSNVSIRNSLGGIQIKPTTQGSAFATLTGVTIAGNSRGIRVEDGSIVNIRDSSFVGNVGHGIIATGATRMVELSVENCVSSNNGASGLYAGPLSTVRISNFMATRNLNGLTGAGGTILSFGNNRISGNTSSDGAPNLTPGQM